MPDKEETTAKKAAEAKKARRAELEKLAKSNPPAQDFAKRIARLEAIIELGQ